jgi:hypothetical protein
MKSTSNPSPSQVDNTLKPEEFNLVIPAGSTGSTIAAGRFSGEGKRDAVLTHPRLVEGLIPLFTSAASAHGANTLQSSLRRELW